MKKAVGAGRKFSAPAVFDYGQVKGSKVLGSAETFKMRANPMVIF